MPTINDATVVASAYDTSGNGGRKLVILKDGTQFAVAKSGTGYYVYRTTNNWGTSTLVRQYTLSVPQDVCLATDGTRVFIYASVNNTQSFCSVLNSNGTQIQTETSVDTGQSAMGNVTSIINDAGTEISVAHASKNSTYANSFNIRYAKGTINADGSVAWSAVEQVTKYNVAGKDVKNPSIVIFNNIPTISAENVGSSITGNNADNGWNSISVYKKDNTLFSHSTYLDVNWTIKSVYSLNTYAQSSPSAIFVPQSINGLANGRIHNFWSGKDATDTTMWNIRYSYSDDGGVTWSAMVKLTSGNTYSQLDVTATANKNNEIFVLWQGLVSNTTTLQVRQLKNVGGVWGSITNKTSMTSNNNVAGGQPFPSTLFDLTMAISEPLFIYRNFDTPKVGFYGTWTVTTISVTQGSIGTKSDRTNVLTYSITTDGSMSTITEKVNGTIIGTKNATSGQSLIAGLTQAQWDAIKFGKYADATGGLNTLTVEMGSEKWTYTFDKRLATSDDVLSAVKAVQDSQTTYLPSVKAKLASSIRARGGTVNDTDSFDTMVSAILTLATLGSKKVATGTTTSSSSVLNVTGLAFSPRIFLGRATSLVTNSLDYSVIYAEKTFFGTSSHLSFYTASTTTTATTPTVTSTGISVPVSSNISYQWVAVE